MRKDIRKNRNEYKQISKITEVLHIFVIKNNKELFITFATNGLTISTFAVEFRKVDEKLQSVFTRVRRLL